MSRIASALAMIALGANATTYFKETFDASFADRWVTAEGSGVVALGKGAHGVDDGLQTTQDAKFYHVSAAFDTFSNEGKDLVLQFSVSHQQKIDCGGGYLKFLPAGLDQATFNGDSDYNIMFGPDICGATKRVHVIFNYKGENHLISSTIPAQTDAHTHVYTLIVHPDQTYAVKIDGEVSREGNLVDDWDFLGPKTIPDPDQSKPDDWVDEAMIDDPEDVKPEGYDDILPTIVDPDATKPEDWDDEDDGEWEAPTIPNPDYQGPWRAARIENPDYKGPWEHPHIPNPDYEHDDSIYSYASFGAVGLDVWQVKSGSIFDNIIITDSEAEADAFREETYGATIEAEKALAEENAAAEAAEAEAARAAAAAEAELEAAAEDAEDDGEVEATDAAGHDEL
jgi:calreticulin